MTNLGVALLVHEDFLLHLDLLLSSLLVVKFCLESDHFLRFLRTIMSSSSFLLSLLFQVIQTATVPPDVLLNMFVLWHSLKYKNLKYFLQKV